jgi:hypothetical protein
MAQYFLYPDPNMYDTGAVVAGSVSGIGASDTFTASSTITNVERVSDQNIGSAISVGTQYHAIRIDMGASSSPNAIALYHTILDDNNLSVYASDDSTIGTAVASWSTDNTAGWNVHDMTVSSLQYLYIVNDQALTWSYCSEIMVGTKYTFDRNYDLGGKFGKVFGVSNVMSYGGVEYSHKRYNGKETWEWEWTRLTDSQMTSLTTLRDAVEGSRFKFLYYDGSDWNWVRMSDKSLQKKQIAYQTYNTSIQLTQQLS